MGNNWIYEGTTITDSNQFPEGTVGFIYHIVADKVDGPREYIGRKQCMSYRKRNFGKREIAAMKDKRKKTYEMVAKESDWKTYTGSNKMLNEFIKEGGKYTKYIVKYCFSKKELSYFENKYLYSHGVIEEDHFFNDNIQGKFYRKDLKREE